MQARVLTVLGLALGVGGAIAMNSACSSSETTTSGSSTAASPPAPPSAAKTASTAEHNFAMHTLFLGDRTRSGQVSNTAWKQYGYNLDGKTSTKDSTDVCKPPGNTRSSKEDGND